MNYTVTKYPQGAFSWTDISSLNMDKTKAFLIGLFGWTAQDMPTGQPGVDYTMFYLDGKVVAGGGQKPPSMQNTPSYWSSYITVDDVDAMIAKAETLGAKVLIRPIDIPNEGGRMAGITDPIGASVMFWQPKKHIGAQLVNTPGAMVWNELYTKDVEKAQSFYSQLLGWTFEPSSNADGTYIIIKNNGRLNGGIMTITPEMGSMPANWTVYFSVKNLEESIAKVKELGGQVYIASKEISVGKIGMIADPAGANFILMQMSIPPQEWEE